jgi:hypothetical protein
MSTSTLKVSDHFHVLHSLGSKRKHCTISGCTVSYAYETSTTILKRHLTKVHLLHVVDAEDELPSTPSSASFSPSLSFFSSINFSFNNKKNCCIAAIHHNGTKIIGQQ